MTAHLLGSFHYLRRADLTAELSRAPGRVDFFADSGAFSAFVSGASVRLEDYASWLVEHARVINAAATLDVIGDPAATERNTNRLITLTGGRVRIVPVFHVGSPWTVLERLCDRHPYVGLGGGVGLNMRMEAMSRWLVKAHRIARDRDVRLHGFGLTRPPYPELFPWYSVDSTYWTTGIRSGSLKLWDGRQFQSLRVGRPSAHRHALLVRRYGGNPARICRPGFALARESGALGTAEREWMCVASIRSDLRYQEAIRVRRGPVAPPSSGDVTGEGIKIYLAAVSLIEARLVIATSADEAAAA